MSEAPVVQNAPVDSQLVHPTPTPEVVESHDQSPARLEQTPESVKDTTNPEAETAVPEAMASVATDLQEPAPKSEPLAAAVEVAAVTPVEVIEEPQNKLTKLFTEKEWTALKEFRAKLPEIFAEAFPEKSDAKATPITLWGVPIDPSSPAKDARVSVVLVKFLRARNLSVFEAEEMLVNTLRWRESFGIEAALKEEFPPNLFENMAHIYGRDKENRPVVYNLYGANPDIKSAFSDVQRFLRWRVALQERSVDLLDFNEVDQMIQIHDYAGASLSSRDANSKAAASEATNIFASHYPEMLYRKFFINVPTLLNWIFWAFKAIIPSATFAKMTVVGPYQFSQRKALLPFIDEKQLPSRYGGEAEAF